MLNGYASVVGSVGAMIVVWTPIEILGKWGVFRAPWILLQSSSFLIFFGGLAVGTVWLWRGGERQAGAGAGAPPGGGRAAQPPGAGGGGGGAPPPPRGGCARPSRLYHT